MVLRKFDMSDLSPQPTPISTSTALDEDLDGEAVDQKEYRSMIGSLLYLTATRPDIQFARLPLRAVSGFAAHLPQAGGETHLQVFEIHP